ncbi:DUF397 domain-containing protein [Catenuloplanes sp. NPDC051500]|uniref:DUF397 domain-containing protein n=1 Tax=Catenuloplanes sp. NPDC051500 TaxID=3363959 RepID=UPI0037A4BACE
MTPASRGRALPWRKSTRSASNGNCVEVANCDSTVYVRDSKDPQGPALAFGRGAWNGLLALTRNPLVRD